MIERSGAQCLWDIYCDACSMSEEICADSFQEVVDDMKTEGWFIRKMGDEWVHYCPDCKYGK